MNGQAAPVVAATPPPHAAITLRTIPAHPELKAPLEIVVVNPPAGATGFSWTLPGASPSTVDTGSQPMVSTRLLSPGVHSLAVQIVAGGRVITGMLPVVVAAPASLRRTAKHAGGPGQTGRVLPAAHRKYTIARRSPARANSSAAGVRAVAHAASDPGVDIIDFAFSPASITVHVGDTVTWTNTGKQPHSATASNGSFDTGILTTGHSGSHTFTQSGTFTYICTVHPYMHGTIVVAAAAGAPSTPASGSGSTAATPAASSTGASSSSHSTNSAAAATQAASGPALPLTGLDIRLATAVGLLLIGLGLTLRRRAGTAD